MSRYIDKAKLAQRLLASPIFKNTQNGDLIRDAVIDIVCDYPAADVIEVKNGEVLMPITKEELAHLINDIIAYIWRLEERKCDKEEFGYFSRKELLEKLKRFEKEHFPELNTSPGD